MKRVIQQKDALNRRRLFWRHSAASIVPRPSRRSDGGGSKREIDQSRPGVHYLSGRLFVFSSLTRAPVSAATGPHLSNERKPE